VKKNHSASMSFPIVISEHARKIKKIGIATCGGDCPGLNPVIRAVVRAAILNYQWEVLGIEDSTCGLIDLNYRGPHGNIPLTLETVEEIICKGGTILGTSNKSHPFCFLQEQPDESVIEVDVSDKVVENFKKLGLDALVMVGGDGTMEIARRLIKKGLPLVGVPKTIDNDLNATDYTFGFNTAVENIVQAVDKIRDTALSHDRVFIVEVMGRNAGWLGLHAGIASASDVILLPEIPYHVDSVLKTVKTRHDNKNFASIILISEGAKPAGGQESLLEKKPGEMPRFQGAAVKLEAQLLALNKKGHPYYLKQLEVRTTVLGYIQRGGTPSNFDRVLGTRLGVKAVELIAEGKIGYMSALKGMSVVAVPMEEANGQKLVVPADEELVKVARIMGISFGDDYREQKRDQAHQSH